MFQRIRRIAQQRRRTSTERRQQKHAVKWIFRMVGRQKWFVVLLCVLDAIGTLIGLGSTMVMKWTVDAATMGDGRMFLTFVGVMVIIVLVQIGLGLLGGYQSAYAEAAISNTFRGKVFEGILRTDYSTTSQLHSGELMNRLTSDVSVVVGGALGMLPGLISLGIQSVGVVALMTLLAPKLTLLFVVAGVCMVLASLPLRGWLKRIHKRVQEAEGVVRSFMQECLENIMVIKVFGCIKKMTIINDRNMWASKRIQIHRANVSNFIGAGLSMAMNVGFFFGFIWCGFGILQGTITYGTMVALMQLIGQMQGPIVSVGGIFPRLATITASAERLMELMPDKGTLTPKQITVTREPLSQSAELEQLEPEDVYDDLAGIDFEHVTFAYDESGQMDKLPGEDDGLENGDANESQGDTIVKRLNVLEDFSLHIKPGSFVGIVGRSGIGKSTLMKLMVGVYQPQAGTIAVRTHNGLSLTPREVPIGFYAYVPQGNFLMSGTIRDVVAFIDPESIIDDERIRESCRVAQAESFINELPDGYDTELGEHGAGLSEGQMQRLAIARAIYSDAPVLLLDESTSALDEDTENELLHAIRELKNRTVLIVTHRPRALEYCDHVVHVGPQEEQEAQPGD